MVRNLESANPCQTKTVSVENFLEYSPQFRGINVTCYLCKDAVVDAEHLFLSCPLTRIIWRTSLWPINLNCIQPLSIHEFIRIILHPNRKLKILVEESHHFQLFAAIACDQIWSLRNKVRLAPSTSIEPLSLSVTN